MQKDNSNNEFGEKFAWSTLFSGIWINKKNTFLPIAVQESNG